MLFDFLGFLYFPTNLILDIASEKSIVFVVYLFSDIQKFLYFIFVFKYSTIQSVGTETTKSIDVKLPSEQKDISSGMELFVHFFNTIDN